MVDEVKTEEELNEDDAGGETGAPEGVPAEIWDAEAKAIAADKVPEYLKGVAEERDNFKKQAEDWHRKYSVRAQAPEKIEDYSAYTAPDDYKSVIEARDTDIGKFVSSGMSDIDKLAYDNAMTVDQAKAVKDSFLSMASGIWPDLMKNPSGDPEKAAADKKAAEEKYASGIKEILGEDYPSILAANQKFLSNYGKLSDGERKFLEEGSKTDPIVAALAYRMRSLFERTGSAMPVHGSVSASGLADDATLNAQIQDMLKAGKTYESPEIKEIIEKRIKAGRPVEFQL